MEFDEEPNYQPIDPANLADMDRQVNEMQDLAALQESQEQPQPEQPQQPQQVTAEQPQPEQPQEEQSSDDQFIPQLMEGEADVGDYLRFGMEMGGAPVAGTADFLVDAVNLIPGVDVPKIPKYQNDLATTLRNLSSLIVPNVFIGGRVVKGLQGATKGYAFAQGALAKWLGTTAVGAGVGAAVDYTVEFNQKDEIGRAHV